MDKDVDELINYLEKILHYNCFTFDLSAHLYPKTLSPIDRDHKFKDQTRLAVSEFQQVFRSYLSGEDFLKSVGVESLNHFRNSHQLVKNNIETKIEQHYEFDGLYRYCGNTITVPEFLMKMTTNFGRFQTSELPVVNVCKATQKVQIHKSDIIIFEVTSKLTSQYWTSKTVHKPLHVKELLRIFKKRNICVGDIFLFLIHDGPTNNYQQTYSGGVIRKIDSTEDVRKLYYAGFFYVRFEGICEIWLNNCPQEYKMLKALQKSRAQTQKAKAQNRKEQAEMKRLTEQKKKLTKELANIKEQIAKKDEELRKQDKQLEVNQNPIVEKMHQKMLEEMRRQASFNPYGQKEREVKPPFGNQVSEDKNSSSSADEIPTTTEPSRERKKGRSRRKKGGHLGQERNEISLTYNFKKVFSANKEPKDLPGAKRKNMQNPEQKQRRKKQYSQEIELKESDFNMVYEGSQLGQLSNSSSLSPSPKKKRRQDELKE